MLERDYNRMDIVRARGQDPETCRELFILAAEILGVAAVRGLGEKLESDLMNQKAGAATVRA